MSYQRIVDNWHTMLKRFLNFSSTTITNAQQRLQHRVHCQGHAAVYRNTAYAGLRLYGLLVTSHGVITVVNCARVHARTGGPQKCGEKAPFSPAARLITQRVRMSFRVELTTTIERLIPLGLNSHCHVRSLCDYDAFVPQLASSRSAFTNDSNN